MDSQCKYMFYVIIMYILSETYYLIWKPYDILYSQFNRCTILKRFLFVFKYVYFLEVLFYIYFIARFIYNDMKYSMVVLKC